MMCSVVASSEQPRNWPSYSEQVSFETPGGVLVLEVTIVARGKAGPAAEREVRLLLKPFGVVLLSGGDASWTLCSPPFRVESCHLCKNLALGRV